MKPSERIKEIMAEIAVRNTLMVKQDAIDRGLTGPALEIYCNPDDPGLIQEAIIVYLDEMDGLQYK